MLVAILGTTNLAMAQSAGGGTPAASDATTGGLEEVTVTAQRRAQSLQDVPIAVTAFSAEDLAAQQIESTMDLGRQVPGMFTSNNVGQGSANVFYIRGLGQTQSFPTFEPQVGLYVDDIYISRVNANNFAFFGVDQLQVLNGPQGTLFGRNSTGGAIVVSLQKPTDQFGGDVSLSYGSFNGVTGTLSVNAPINDMLLTRTSFYGVTNDGYVDDLTTGQKLNATHNFGLREALAVVPSGSLFRWDLSVDYERNDSANNLNQPNPDDPSQRISYSGFSTHGGVLLPYLTGEKATLGQGALVTTYGFASNVKLNFDAGTLNFITGFRGTHQALASDFQLSAFGPLNDGADAIPTGELVLAQEATNDEYTQEVKWTAQVGDTFNYSTGVYYLYELSRDDYGQVLGLGPDFAVPLSDQFARNWTSSIAPYFQGDLKLTPKLTVTLGARFTHEVKSVDLHADQPGLGFDTAALIAAGYPNRLTADEFTPRVAFQYQADPQTMLFVSATRGFQGGGWNGLTGADPVAYNNFAPETVWSYETGFRYETEDHRLRLNATAYYMDVKSDQLLYDNPFLPAGNTFDTGNVADMAAYGLETSFDWRPVDNLTLSGNLSTMKAEYYDPSAIVTQQIAQCVAGVAGTCDSGIVRQNGTLATPVYTPPLSVTLNASYKFNFDSFSLTPKASVQYTASEWFDVANTSGYANSSPPALTGGLLSGGETRPRKLLDVGVTYAPRDIPLTITAECKNCTMQNYGTADLIGLDYFNYPGTWDIRFAYKFGGGPAPRATPPPAPVAVAAPPPPPPPPPPPVVAAPPPCPPAPAGFKLDANCHIIEQTLVVRAIDFEFNRDQLTPPARQTLDDVARALVAQPELMVEIQGYTDSIGSAEYNLKLSQRRAEAVKAYLESRGVKSSGLTAKGFGKENPIASNKTEEGRAENRRVVFHLSHAPTALHVVNEGATEASTEAAEKHDEPPRKTGKP
jgi:iron complex outermembrane receptor protein